MIEDRAHKKLYLLILECISDINQRLIYLKHIAL